MFGLKLNCFEKAKAGGLFFIFSITKLSLENECSSLLITTCFTKQHKTTMHTISIRYALIWQVKNAEHYKVSKCGKVFNCRSGKCLKRTVNGGSFGYWLQGKFYTLQALRQLLERINSNDCPF